MALQGKGPGGGESVRPPIPLPCASPQGMAQTQQYPPESPVGLASQYPPQKQTALQSPFLAQVSPVLTIGCGHYRGLQRWGAVSVCGPDGIAAITV